MPFAEKDADFEGNLVETTYRVTYIVSRLIPVRSGDTHARVPPVPKLVSQMVEPQTIESAIAPQPAGGVPPLAMDLFEKAC